MSKKPNCYDCKFRRNVPGDAHSACHHPSVSDVVNDPIMGIASILSGAGRIAQPELKNPIKIVGNEHGIRNGWFFWPLNFDPAWLEECEGFTQTTT